MELDHKMIGHLIVKVNCLPTNHHKMMAVAANWQQQKESRKQGAFYCSTQSTASREVELKSSSALERSAPYLAVRLVLQLKSLDLQVSLVFDLGLFNILGWLF